MDNNKRIYLWDNLKFILILFVVIGHFLGQYRESSLFKSCYLFIYSFHMPLFLFISGLFHKNENITQKVFRYLAIGYIYKIVLFVVNYYICNQDTKIYFLEENTTPWFMFSLAFFVLMTYILRSIDKKLVLVISIIIACFVGYDESIGDFLVLSRNFVFFPFYHLGTMLDKDSLCKFVSRKKYIFLGVIIILMWVLMCVYKLDELYVLKPLFLGRHHFDKNIYAYGFVYRMVCYCIALVVGFSVIALTPDFRIPIISECGKRTLQVYFWHRPILCIFANYGVVEMLCNDYFGKIVYIFISIALTFILSHKIFSFPTKQIMNNK